MQLVVDSRPFLILGGELHNSSGSDLEHLKTVWPKMKALNFNTVLAPVYWELLEPREGQFDFRLVDGLIAQARKNQMHLVLLWFGSWKNGVSSYIPYWMKVDTSRFPRVQDRNGRSLDVLSCLSESNLHADERAFAALMRHIRQVDGRQHTVLMVQVENEVGVRPDSRDRSAAADAAFAQPVPRELMEYLQMNRSRLHPDLLQVWRAAGGRTSGTWAQVFGSSRSADAIFEAWHYSRYVNSVAAAGKAEYPIPMCANAWLDGAGAPGDYPSGGPVARVLDVWRAGATQLDLLAPDIYADDFAGYCAQFARNGNPLFIPEARADARSGPNSFYAIGRHHAIGFSPFGVDSMPDPANQPLAANNAVLAQLTPLILEYAGSCNLTAVIVTQEKPQEEIRLGNFTLNLKLAAARRQPAPAVAQGASQPLVDPGFALIISLAGGEFVLAGAGISVTFGSPNPDRPVAGIAYVEEGKFVSGKWVPGRRLNGDENAGGTAVSLPRGNPGILKFKLYSYR
jgi:hypothetical protein